MKIFNQVQNRRLKANAFDLSHEKKLSMNMADLVPILCQEVVPGDKFRVNTETLIRLAPMTAPMMHRVNAYVHYFFVPNRLVYGEWEDFITGGERGDKTPIFPQIQYWDGSKTMFTKGSLADYMGVPIIPENVTVSEQANQYISALPFRAYQMIYNEYYRDQNLQDKVPFTKDSVLTGNEWQQILTIRKRNWEKDYFTSSLPWTQKGSEVILPTDINYKAPNLVLNSSGAMQQDGALTSNAGELLGGATGTSPTVIDNIENIGTTINDLRRAVRLQEWLERNARSGSRYIEQILAHFQVVSKDARLQRPEYLGGGKTPVTVSEVLSTYGDANVPQGNMAGHGIAVGNTNQFSRFFEEHGYVLGIMSVLPSTSYSQGLPKHFQKFDKFDYYFPEFAHLGEQEVNNKELYIDLTATDNYNSEVFGYQSRYCEYKYAPSTIHGDFKDNLKYWHMGRIFSSRPALNSAFITADPTTRVFAVSEDPSHKLYVQLYNKITAIRRMPYFGTPSL